MISDPSGRYLLTQLGNQLWHYDARWRHAALFDVSAENPVAVAEGNGHLSVIVHEEDHTTVTVRVASNPDTAVATGVFAAGQWTFLGDHHAWAHVPDYILVPLETQGLETQGLGLLRLADGAVVDPLEGNRKITQVIDIPQSRLVVLLGEGSWSIYDPISHRAFGSHELAEKNQNSIMRFRTPEEVWINDITTMLKLDGKKFIVADAAGSEFAAQDIDSAPEIGQFGRWTFAGGGELCVVPRPNLRDVLILDVVSMLPVAQTVFTTGQPADAAMVGRNTVVAVSEDGRVLRGRARKIRLN